jgi:hypothetical protein
MWASGGVDGDGVDALVGGDADLLIAFEVGGGPAPGTATGYSSNSSRSSMRAPRLLSGPATGM